jgi:preprotein translocase subunit YajC
LQACGPRVIGFSSSLLGFCDVHAVRLQARRGIIRDLFDRPAAMPAAVLPGDTMDFFIANAQAQAAAPGAAANPLISFLPLIVLFGIFYFMLIRPQMKRAKEARTMIAALAKGDEVLTNGGLLGRIEDIADQFVVLEIAPNVSVKLQKQAISAVLPKGTLKAA